MKYRTRLIYLALVIAQLFILLACTAPYDVPQLTDEKWYNDELSIKFDPDRTFKSYYTMGKTEGSVSGKYSWNPETGVQLHIKKKEGAEIPFFGDIIRFELLDAKKGGKTEKELRCPDKNIVLWRKDFLIEEGRIITWGIENCQTLGYTLSTTTDNLRIRTGPGIHYDALDYTYMSADGNVKTHGSVLKGTNIRLLARTVKMHKVLDWKHYWYLIEYKEPLEGYFAYKTAWMFGEFLDIPENSGRSVEIIEPENGSSVYNREILIKGSVNGDPVSIDYEYIDSYGNPEGTKRRISDYNRLDHIFSLPLEVGKSGEAYFGSNILRFTANYADGSIVEKQLTFYAHEYMGEKAKPVIYLYPPEKMKVSVQVEPTHGISVSDPPYGDGWNVIAYPDGRLENLEDRRTYPYLFWESPDDGGACFDSGFVVKTSELPVFFTEKLSHMGLNGKEIKDFLDFWIPELKRKDYYLIHFFTQEYQNQTAPLSIFPEPDTIIRVLFDSKPLDAPVSVCAQVLPRGQRKGFTVIEWGGMRYRE